MSTISTRESEAWEGEGGATRPLTGDFADLTSGTVAQMEWGERIRRQVDAKFERVAATFQSIAAKQSDEKRAETEAIIAIVEEKRAEVTGRVEAGYFIHDWQEITDQVRRMIFDDPRFQAIRSNRAARLRNLSSEAGSAG